MSCELDVEHPPLAFDELLSKIRSLMGKLGCHPWPDQRPDALDVTSELSWISFGWRDPCLYRALAEHTNHSTSWSTFDAIEKQYYSPGRSPEETRLRFTLRNKDSAESSVSEVYYSEPLGAVNSRFLMMWIILFLTQELKASSIQGLEKKALDPFYSFRDEVVRVCKIPGWSFKIPADEEYGPTADRDPWI